MQTALEMIAAERARQISAEGYSLRHDDHHDQGQLALAAACYAVGVDLVAEDDGQHILEGEAVWPFEGATADAVEGKDELRRLTIAGALIVAEMERLQRAAGEVADTAAPAFFVDVVFDGPPDHESGRFVEVENGAGASISVGTWIDRGNGLWALRIPMAQPAAEQRS